MLRTCFYLCVAVVFALPSGAQVELTYLANEGFLVDSGDQKVLVDALFGPGLRGYPAVPEPIRADLETAKMPFAGVDLILASHYHGDHFNAQSVVRYMNAEPKSRFVSTQQAVAEVLKVAPELKDRCRGFWPKEGQTESLTMAGIELKVWRLHHGRSRRPEVQNLGLIFNLGGLKLLHVGDTEVTLKDIQVYRPEDAEIDIALLPTWFYRSTEQKKIVDRLSKSQLVVMHMGDVDAPSHYFSPSRNRTELIRELGDQYPEAWVPTRPLEQRKYQTRPRP